MNSTFLLVNYSKKVTSCWNNLLNLLFLKININDKYMKIKKRETSQNKIRYSSRKRKIIAMTPLSWILLWGKTRLSSSQSSSPNFDTKVVWEKIIDDQEFCSFEDNDRQMILTKIGDSEPSVPTSSIRGHPSNFPTPLAGDRLQIGLYMYQNIIQRLK